MKYNLAALLLPPQKNPDTLDNAAGKIIPQKMLMQD
jgi:hypothetical protein